MKIQKGDVAVIAIIIVIVAITTGIIGWMFIGQLQMPKQQTDIAPSVPAVQSRTQPLEAVVDRGIESVQTSIDEKICRTIKTESEGEVVVQHCPGIANYILQADYADARESVTIISPEKKEYPLSFWDTVGYGFSYLNKTAEWRLTTGADNKKHPIAILIPFSMSEVNATLGTQDPYKDYLVIAKITPTEVCVTDVLDLSDKNNARQEVQWQIADTAASRSCKKMSQ